MRTISLQITPAEQETLLNSMTADITSAERDAIATQDKSAYRRLSNIEPRALLNDAIGHLSMWALPQDDAPQGYHHVVIRCADAEQPELVACYYHDVTSTTPGYVIGAIWHGDHFGFHS